MKLYEISNRLHQFIEVGFDEDCIDQETGEILEDKVREKLEELMLSFEDRAEGTALFIKNLEAEAKAIKEEEKNLKERRDRKEKKAASLKNYLLYVMELAQKEKFETTKVNLYFTKSKAVKITDETKLAEEYLRTKTTVEPDKTAIKEALTKGIEVAGAELEARKNLQIK